MDLERLQAQHLLVRLTATAQELDSLLGIGPVKAQAIIDNRPYRSTEDLMKIKGIKEGIYGKIKDSITVEFTSKFWSR